MHSANSPNTMNNITQLTTWMSSSKEDTFKGGMINKEKSTKEK